ncbi:CHAD domain-containing protein [Limimaricola variabilis]|uniref:CHAD domain-containing protein n=1 Tax=Limimaricola variabilis TaxID=1492771 RepID=A0ABR6HMB0_9RHOB|nr:CHAD domain-containing protein [Limimaricola variabilis]MBB3711700.1 CHAD domain-containing protein [Limimaricola variabilis]
MGFRIAPEDSSLKTGLRRVLAERGARAAGHAAEADMEEAIHALRKDTKKARALLRLMRPGLSVFKAENRALRDAARALSGHRDAQARLDSFDKLTTHYANEIDRRAYAGLRTALTREARAAQNGGENELAALRAALEQMGERAGHWRIEGKGRVLLHEGLERSLARAARALAAAEEAPDAARLHELRKRAKDHRAHMKLLRPAWPALIDAREKQAKRLGDLIGDHHDLDALCAHLAARELPRDETARAALTALAARRQADLAAEALPVARRLFGAPPEETAARLVALWRLWRRETAGAR